MGLLSAILPGVRDFRTPFVTGVLWVFVGALVLHQTYSGNFPQYAGVRAVSAVLAPLPDGVAWALLGGIAYVVGSVAEGFARRFETSNVRERLLEGLVAKTGSSWSYRLHAFLNIPGDESHQLVISAVNDRLANLPSVVRGLVSQMIMNEFHLTAHALHSSKPEQYQHYDRLRSEYELRNGIWPPILILTIVCSTLVPWPESGLIALGGGTAVVVLAAQAVDRRREANVYIAQSIYSGWARPPLFASLTSAMAEHRTINDLDYVDRVIWLLEFFAARDMSDRLGQTISKLRHPSRSSLQGEDGDRLMEALAYYSHLGEGYEPRWGNRSQQSDGPPSTPESEQE
ncbi:hypothetical protein ACQEVI_19780 [Promicromonospora sp. CA-289599]|uniref:hypothetical protein n=1 Tax=Promicromonospora sp. CA-289599 TaxID=3240014 RepID=UPI003D9090DC